MSSSGSTHRPFKVKLILPRLELKADDVKKACENPDTDWIKEFQKLYPDTICAATPAVSVFCTGCKCDGKTKLQDCSAADKTSIYGTSPPNSAYTDLGKFLEATLKCTGYCSKCRTKYYYSDSNNKYILSSIDIETTKTRAATTPSSMSSKVCPNF